MCAETKEGNRCRAELRDSARAPLSSATLTMSPFPQMARPIQVKPADSESRGGSSDLPVAVGLCSLRVGAPSGSDCSPRLQIPHTFPLPSRVPEGCRLGMWGEVWARMLGPYLCMCRSSVKPALLVPVTLHLAVYPDRTPLPHTHTYNSFLPCLLLLTVPTSCLFFPDAPKRLCLHSSFPLTLMSDRYLSMVSLVTWLSFLGDGAVGRPEQRSWGSAGQG